MADNKGFMGRGFSFPFRVDPSTNRIAMSSAGQDVEEAIRIILRTNLGERVMLPEFGTAAGEFLFSDSRAERIAALEESVREAGLSNGSRVSWISTCRQRAKAPGEC